jgi:hypothetical protein
MIERELELRLCAALVGDDVPDWLDVRRRVAKRSSRPLTTFALVGIAAVLAFGSQALGVGPQLSLFGGGVPAPVKQAFSDHHDGGIDPRTLRLAAATRTQDGRALRLWQARKAAHDGTCALITIAGHSTALACGRATAGTVGMLVETGDTAGRKPGLAFIGGIAPRSTSIIRLAFQDGTKQDVNVRDGAWIAEIPALQRRYGHALVRVDAVGVNGAVTASLRVRAPRRPAHAVGTASIVARLAGRPLAVARSSEGGLCLGFHRADGIGVDFCGKPPLLPAAWLVRIAPPGRLGRLVLLGPATRNATRVVIERSDGSHLDVPVRSGVFAVVLPRPARSRPVRIVEIDAQGHRSALRIGTPAAGVYAPAWHGALYTKISLGRMNRLGYMVGRLIWPDGRITPARPS